LKWQENNTGWQELAWLARISTASAARSYSFEIEGPAAEAGGVSRKSMSSDSFELKGGTG
jgi:hypothetical protein